MTGLEGGLAPGVSDDGIHFRRDWTQLGMRLFPHYLPAHDPARESDDTQHTTAGSVFSWKPPASSDKPDWVRPVSLVTPLAKGTP